MLIGVRKLDAHDQRLNTAEQQESERGDQIADTDHLVINRSKPSAQPRWRLPYLLQARRNRRVASLGNHGGAIKVSVGHVRFHYFRLPR
ncbi:hypothetical protein GALL_500560 [mine drainage metagenome]|uniref:Uncharacterized protein n=1 Tax=mine drainage metagenome TaxID=410659 RepID=A0A1J5PAW3_9ZZZZ